MSAEQSAGRSLIRVAVVDDQAIVRSGVQALLATEPDLEVVGEAADGEAAVLLVERLRPDVVLMDLLMPGVDGLEAIRRLAGRDLGTRILVLTSFAGDDNVFPAIKAGALGYLLKDSSPADLVQANFWFTLAAGRGNPNGAINRDNTTRRMTEAQRAQVEKMLAEWQAKSAATRP